MGRGTSTSRHRVCSAARSGFAAAGSRRRPLPAVSATSGSPPPAGERTARSWTVQRWLRYWLSTRDNLRPTTLLHYTRDVEQVLIPWFGTLTLADLDAPLLRARFAEIARTVNRRGQPRSPAAMKHLRATLCAALNLAVREGLIGSNPARHIEIHGYRRPHAQVWTDDRIAHWQKTGTRPAVAVWTVEHLATFLTAMAGDNLYALWWLIGLRGLRRGEACGLRWSEVDLDRGILFVVRNRTTVGYRVERLRRKAVKPRPLFCCARSSSCGPREAVGGVGLSRPFIISICSVIMN
jgi:integrase